ncbi:ABC transporter permease [Endozoicomonas sp. SM1973]|uniref:Transport permease protein n=1 Tax=Spartinivicinus marinus TaxID=2994442 RepID=A0A853HYX5_9GAMM|nr:ABC transporter permease [Spartinivicinus marinus]MCX4028848.1 ABC transporter permease [Spartinivicinus marinus]NYZ65569.1 ABC transporter permease [Spartinivicinus marinus]
MNSKQKNSYSLISGIRLVIKNWELVSQTTKRDIISRYRGSIAGVTWAFFYPVILLAVYTVVFSVIFKARWIPGNIDESKIDFALILFIGMIYFNFFSESINRSPLIINSNVNFVKKVVFPIELLPINIILSAFFHLLISIFVWGGAMLFFKGSIPITTIYLPLVLLPFLLFMTGLSFMLSAVGVYLKDMSQLTGVISTMMMFLSPIFFSLETVPDQLKWFMKINPLTYFIEESRTLMFFGEKPDLKLCLIYWVLGIVALQIGYFFFQKTRKGFADVI